jgi:membrane-bound lytic murein transglycosylase D
MLGALPLTHHRTDLLLLGVPSPDNAVRAAAPVQTPRPAPVQTAAAEPPQNAGQDEPTVEDKSEPAPIDEIAAQAPAVEGAPLPPIDPNLRTRAEGELHEVSHDLPLTVNDPVLAFVNYFQTTRGRAIVETGLRRAGKFRPMIERVLREEGMPSDLIYLAQAESAFQPQALSRAGARGLWQFMSFRGEQYGLAHDRWVDDRQDPEKATRAAATHLRDLYQMFGDWYLAMAAYNSGPGTVEKAVERSGYADFWELYRRNVLPKETRNYVPIILAMTLIAKDPARYGIDVVPEEPLRFDEVALSHPIDLRLVADTLDVDVDTLRALNPQLLRLVTPADRPFALHIPAGASDRFLSEMAAIPPENWATWRRHRIAEGETLSSIARQYHLGTTAIAEANNLETGSALEAGDKLIIPVTASPQLSAGKLVRYRARQGDTLATIADEFDVSVAELKKWNSLTATSKLVRGTRLKIYSGAPLPPPDHKTAATPRVAVVVNTAQNAPRKIALQSVSYRVREGETLWSIAQTFKTTVATLQSANQYLFSRPLQAGDTLVIASTR